jgi:tripartite-type tricarboxylate transporter receptor subunit TctC
MLARFLLAFVAIGICGPSAAREPWRLIVPYPSTGPREVHDLDRATRSLRAIVAHAPPPITELMADLVMQALTVDSTVSVARDRRFRGGAAGLERVFSNRSAAMYAMILAGADVLLAGDGEPGQRVALDQVTLIEPVAIMPFVLICGPMRCDRNSRTIEKIIADRPRAFASAGAYTTSYAAAVALLRVIGRPSMHLAYGGGTSVLNALSAGQVDFSFVPLPAAIPHVSAGRLYPVGIASSDRFVGLSHLPTLDELGLKGFRAEAWFALVAPAAVTAASIKLLRAPVMAYRLEQASRDVLRSRGLVPAEPLAQFAERVSATRAQRAERAPQS